MDDMKIMEWLFGAIATLLTGGVLNMHRVHSADKKEKEEKIRENELLLVRLSDKLDSEVSVLKAEQNTGIIL